MPMDPSGRDAAFLPMYQQEEWNEACRLRRDCPATVYHYTTAEGLRGIVQEATLRATNFSFLNDPSEVQYGRDLALALLEDAITSTPLARRNLIEHTRNALQDKVLSESYVSCFTELSDDLGQWRAYGSLAAERYCIGFDGHELAGIFGSRPGGRFVEILYKPAAQEELLGSLLSRAWTYVEKAGIAVDGWPDFARVIAGTIASRLAELKNPAYAAEAEWRIIRWHDGLEHDRLSFDTSRGVLRPYLPAPLLEPLPIRSLHVMAPARRAPAVKAAELLLLEAGLSDVPVTHSTIPFAD
jgi:hypothetical protein